MFWHLEFYRDGKRTGGDIVNDASSSVELAIALAKSLMQNNTFPCCGKANLCLVKRQDGSLVREVVANA